MRGFFVWGKWHGIFTWFYVKILLLYAICIVLASCTLPEEKKIQEEMDSVDKTMITTLDSNAAIFQVPEPPVITTEKVKDPNGIYQVLLPSNGKMEQTISFSADNTYRLQEVYYPGKKDSIITSTGTWAPSNGYIWIYEDQLVRGRYSWKGDVLQYFNPLSKKDFSMHRLNDILGNKVWAKRKQQSIKVFGIGNEPFWSIELNKDDSLVFRMSDWSKPLRMKVISSNKTNQSQTLIARNDSTDLQLIIYPLFCSDGMSDYVYPRKTRVIHNGKVFNGCGVVYEE